MQTEITILKERELALDIAGGRISSFRHKDITKKGVRIFRHGRIEAASHVGEISDDALIAQCTRSGIPGLAYEHALPKPASYRQSLLKSGPDLDGIEDDMSALLELVCTGAPDFTFSGKANRSILTKAMTSSFGLDHEIEFKTTTWFLTYRRHGSASIIDGAFGDQSIDGTNMESVAKRYLPFLKSWDKVTTIKNGSYPILFIDPQELIGGLEDSLRADKYHDNAALFSGRLGEKILSDSLTIYDVNNAPRQGIFSPFDGEGVVRDRPFLPLIENGILKTLIYDLRNAHKREVETTGNGQRRYDSSALLGFNALSIAPGTRALQDILEELDNCVVVLLAAGGDSTDTGEYSTPVQLSFLLRRGEIVGRLPQLTLNSKIQDYFGPRLLEISRDGFQDEALNPCVFADMNVQIN